MGQTIWVDIEGRSKGEALPDNSIMLRLDEPLRKLCDKLHLATLSDFFDYSILEKEFTGESGGESWFDPAPALAAVTTLRQHLSQRFEELEFDFDHSRKHWPAALMKELAYSEETLQRAVASGRKFRFLIVP